MVSLAESTTSTITKVDVSGAGIASVNGAYIKQACQYGTQDVIYAMESEWAGTAATYNIIQQAMQCGRNNTNDSFWSIGFHTEDKWTTLFRSNVATDAKCSTPPSRGWWPDAEAEAVGANAVHPPLVQLHGVDSFLDWRQDSDQSLSDWTIRVAHDGRHTVDVYHAHRFALAKESRYFRGLFVGKSDECSLAESRDSTSTIKLSPALAALFPCFLDYLYLDSLDARSSFGLQYSCAAGMYYFGDYFQIPRLLHEVELFWKEYMTLSNCCMFVENALVLGVQPLTDAVIELCATELCQLRAEHVRNLEKVVNGFFWISVLQKNDTLEVENHRASNIIAQVCGNMPADIFQVCIALLSSVTETAALPLLQKESEIVDYDQIDGLTRLQDLCVTALEDCVLWTSTQVKLPFKLSQPSLYGSLWRPFKEVMYIVGVTNKSEHALVVGTKLGGACFVSDYHVAPLRRS